MTESKKKNLSLKTRTIMTRFTVFIKQTTITNYKQWLCLNSGAAFFEG